MNDYQNTYDFEHIREQAVGSVEFVSPHEIKVLLDINAPKNTAINTGTPQLFPKVNGFVLIPNEAGALVCIISWVGVEYSQFPKRKGDRKSTRLNSSHVAISYAVFCLKKKIKKTCDIRNVL